MLSLLFGTTSVPNGKYTSDSFPNKLYKIFPKLQHLPPLHHSYSRKEQVILNRLLIGHTHLTRSYLLNKEQPPNCNYCKSLLTVEHILTSCSAYNNIREKHYSNYQISHILTNISKQHIFNYLSEINILKTNFNFLYGTMAYCAESAVKPQPTNQPLESDVIKDQLVGLRVTNLRHWRLPRLCLSESLSRNLDEIA